eukprot:jgi/Hompol1/3931/HPOL_006874-RA
MARMESLEKEVRELEAARQDLQLRVVMLESENKTLVTKMGQVDERNRLLERQLTEAHQNIIRMNGGQ